MCGRSMACSAVAPQWPSTAWGGEAADASRFARAWRRSQGTDTLAAFWHGDKRRMSVFACTGSAYAELTAACRSVLSRRRRPRRSHALRAACKAQASPCGVIRVMIGPPRTHIIPTQCSGSAGHAHLLRRIKTSRRPQPPCRR
jgi:hypothetical protein